MKNGLVNRVNRVFCAAEERGSLKRMPAFVESYRDYPQFQILEEGHPKIAAECSKLLEHQEEITSLEALGGEYTAGGIHTVKWKSFMLKCGVFIPQNAERCPRTTELLRELPDVYTAFFSILEPRQYIKPHWGYYKGLVRYHLGVIIPNDNANEECWLRIQTDPAQNAAAGAPKPPPYAKRQEALERAQKHFWKNGKGVFWDDTYLHDAANDSDETRVVLYLDVAKKMPTRWLDLFNKTCLAIAYRHPAVRNVRKNAVIQPAPQPPIGTAR